VDDDGDLFDIDQAQDQTYNSFGLILTGGYKYDYKFLRFKVYSGLGIHKIFYQSTLYNKYGFKGRVIEDGNTYPMKKAFDMNVISVHLGIEVGIRF
jgi:hypothetical protein